MAERLRDLDDAQGGAVFIMCLAGILIIVLFAMMIFDAAVATRDKTRVQASADFAALSQASVKARAMNQVVYLNIAKRSIWGIHSLYPAHIAGYREFLFSNIPGVCEWENDRWRVEGTAGDDWDIGDYEFDQHRRCSVLETSLNQHFEREVELEYGVIDGDSIPSDWHYFSGQDFSDFHPNVVGNPANWPDVAPTPDSASVTYFARDIHAIDNIQRFVIGAAPWWGWAEKLLFGIRNGATMTASYPPPPTEFGPTANQFMLIGQMAGNQFNPYGEYGIGSSDVYDRLPVTPGFAGAMRGHIQGQLANLSTTSATANLNAANNPTNAFIMEHMANQSRLVTRSGGTFYSCARALIDDDTEECIEFQFCSQDMIDGEGALCIEYAQEMVNLVWAGIPTNYFLDEGMSYSEQAFTMEGRDPEISQPWLLDGSGAEWLRNSSNIVVTYKADTGEYRGNTGREKFRFQNATTDQFHETGFSANHRRMYDSFGYWGMARGELGYGNAGQPADMWHPVWTGRIRPISFRGEFEDLGLDMEEVFHSMLPFLAMGHEFGMSDMANLISGTNEAAHQQRLDMARMDWMMRAMTRETVGGVAK